MTFIWRMAARELRASWKRLLFFFLCVAIGVGAIIALRSMIQSVRNAFAGEARALLSADVSLRSNQPWDTRTLARLKRRLSTSPVLQRTDSVETATMVRPADETKAVARTVELRAVQPGFPFYGRITLEDGRPYSHGLLVNHGALVRRELLVQLDVAVGDEIVIGGAPYVIRGVIASEPGTRLGAFSLGPRVLVDYEDLQRSGLLKYGSRARYQILLRVLEPAIEPLTESLQQEFRDRSFSVRSYRTVEDDIAEDLEDSEGYLSMVGFVILALGGIGVWSVTRVFVRQKIKSIAVLKCLGASTRGIFAIYVTQVILLSLAGGILGIGLAAALIGAAPAAAASIGPTLSAIPFGLTTSAVTQGLLVGVLVSLLFALVPLLDIRSIKPLLLLRHETARTGPAASAGMGKRRQMVARVRQAWGEIDWLRWGTIALVSAALVGVSIWQARDFEVGLYVAGGFVGTAIILHLAGLALVRVVSPLSNARSFALRHAVMSLTRPGSQARVVLLAVGLGSFFIIGVRSLETNLLRAIAVEVRAESPDLFLIDIQQDQAAPLSSFLKEAAGPFRLIPVLRARVSGVRGREVNLEGFEDVRGRGSLGREYVITYRNNLQPNETLIEGTFWGSRDVRPGGMSEVSIESSIKQRFQINVGDVMRFDVLGRTIRAQVTSIRHVDWDDSRNGGFMFVFRPDALAKAPHTYIGMVKGPADATERARLQRDLVERFPNVTAIDGLEILRVVQDIVAKVTLGITVIGLVALLTGTLILAGAVAMTKFQRLYESAIFKTLGATTRTIASMLVLEYSVLGALAGVLGSAAALVLSWAMSRYLFEIEWAPTFDHVTGVLVTTLAAGAVGVLSSLDVLRRKPLATLRAE